MLNALYIDFNSYFASTEQQLNPMLRGKPIGVLPTMAETTSCIVASYEAKAFETKQVLWCAMPANYVLLTTSIKVKVKFKQHFSFKGESEVSATDDTITLTDSLETLWKQYPCYSDDPPIAVSISFSDLFQAQEVTQDLFTKNHL